MKAYLFLMPRSIEVFSPCLRGGTFLLIARWNLLLIKSANFRVHSGIQSPSTSTVQTSVSHSSGSRSLNRGSCCTPKFALFIRAISYERRLFRLPKIKKKLKEFLLFEVIK